MSEPIAASGSPYNTQIPSLDENADIQTALRYYHYGEDTSELAIGDLNPDSMAGFLNGLENSKVTRTPATIPNNANLNESPYISTGFFHQSDPTWSQGATYPKINNVGYAGLLKVVNSGGAIYQEYHMTGVPGFNIVVFYRSKLPSGSWPTSWTRVSDSTHIHDERYYQESESDDRFLVVNGQNNARSAISATPAIGDTVYFDGSKWVNYPLVGYRLVQTLRYPTAGTYTFNRSLYPWLRAIEIMMVGGGAAGGSGNSGDTACAGGGAGGYAESFITNVSSLPTSLSVIVGAGGVPSVLNTDLTRNGSRSFFGNVTGNPPTIEAPGGNGVNVNSTIPGFGGSGGLGEFLIPGGDGGTGRGGLGVQAGNGGASFFGGGGAGGHPNNTVGQPGRAYGSGGGGALRDSGTFLGGNGAPGLVILKLYAL
jgi:hypothetical protein